MASQLSPHPSRPPHGGREQPSHPLTEEERGEGTASNELRSPTPTLRHSAPGLNPVGQGDASSPHPLVPSALLPDVLEHISEAVIGVDHQGRILYWNRGAEAIFGWTAEEALGRRLNRLHLYVGDTGGDKCLFGGKRKSSGKGTSFTTPPPATEPKEAEWKCISKSGRRLILKGRVVPIYSVHQPGLDGPPEPDRWLIIGQDVTEARRAERRAAQLAVINAIMRRISTTHDLNAIAQTVAEALHEHLGFSRATVLWLDRATQELVLAAHRTTTDPAPASYRQKITIGVMGRAVRTGQPQLVRDTRRDPDYITSGRHRRSELCVPIQHGGEVLGVINLESERPGAFDEDDVESVQTIADGLAMALENAQLLKEGRRASEELEQRVQARTRELNAMRETLLDITAQLDLPQVLHAIAKRAADLVAAKGGLIELLDAGRNELEYVASYGIERDYTGWRLGLGEGLSGRVAASGQPIIVDNYQTWEGRATIYAGEPFTALAGVPLEWQGRVIGVLSVVDDIAERTFTQEDVRRLMLLAPQAAIAIVSARLYDEERRARTQAETLRELAEVVNSSLNLHDVLRAVVAKAAAAVGVKRASLALVDTGRGVLYGAASTPMPELSHLWPLWRSLDLPLADYALMAPAVMTGQAVVYPDALADPHMRFFARKFNIRSLLIAPLLSKGHFLGLLAFDQPGELHHFSDQDIALAQAIAHQVAIAVRNAHLYADTLAKAERLAVINALDRAIHSGSLDLRQLFETFAAQTHRLVPYDRMSLALLEGDQYRILAVEPELTEGISKEIWLPRQGTSFDWAIEHNQTLVRPDITQPPHFTTDALLAPAGIRATVVVPLMARGRALGTWNMARCQPNAFSPEEIEIFEMVAGQLAIALDNIRLHQDLAEQAARLQQAYNQLEQADRLKDEMIQNISHELRMPLTIVRGYLELILEGALGEVPPGLSEALRTASQRADEIVEIVERITTLHGLRLGGLELKRLSLSTLVRQAASIARRAAQNAGLRLQVALPDNELYVQGDAERLLQVLSSLLDNAIKFNRPGGHILITARENDGLVSVEVTDSGIGIPADRLERVWDPFYQVDGSTTRRYGGMGVGLALVKEVIEAHGGAVWVRSTEGQGSTFGFGLRRSP